MPPWPDQGKFKHTRDFWGPLERVPSKEGDARGLNRETAARSGMHFIYDRFRQRIADPLGK